MKTKTKIKASVFTLILSLSLMIANNFLRTPNDNLTLKNIEALAEDETTYEDYIDCYGEGSIDCPGIKEKVKRIESTYSLWKKYNF